MMGFGTLDLRTGSEISMVDCPPQRFIRGLWFYSAIVDKNCWMFAQLRACNTYWGLVSGIGLGIWFVMGGGWCMLLMRF